MLWLRVRVRAAHTPQVRLPVTAHQDRRSTAFNERFFSVHDVERTQGAPAAGPIHVVELRLKVRLLVHVPVHRR